jgi:hypothetical protein
METPPITPTLEEPKKTNTWLIVGIVAVVLCCCCAIAAAAAWNLGDCLTNPNDPAICPLASTLISTL